MDTRFWILVVPLWFLVLVNLLVSLMPVAPWARMRGWRIARILSVAMLGLLATSLTLSVLARERRGIFDFSSDAFLILGFTLSGLAILAALGAVFVLMVRTPEAARALHVPPLLYAWLYERTINESLQPAPSPQSLPGDDR